MDWKEKMERHKLANKQIEEKFSEPAWQCDWILGNGKRCEHAACLVAPWNGRKILICRDHESAVSSVTPIKIEELKENEFRCSHRVGISQCKNYAHYYTMGAPNMFWCRIHSLEVTGERKLAKNEKLLHPIIKKDDTKKKAKTFLSVEKEKIQLKNPFLV